MSESKVKLFDRGSNSVVTISQDQVEAHIQSGRFEFLSGRKIPVVTPEGETGKLSAEDATQALQEGFSFDTDMMQQQRLRREQFDERDADAFIAGAARGATLGLSDTLMTKSGLVDPDTLRDLDEINPGASTAGEVSGFVATLMSPAKAGGAGKAVLGAGKLAEKGATSLLRKAGVEASDRLMAKMLTKATPIAARGAAEGATLELGHLVSEEALGRADLTAENVMGAIGYGALMGASGEVIFKGLTSGVKAGTALSKKGVSKVSNKFFNRETAAMDLLGVQDGALKRLNRDGITSADIANFLDDAVIPAKGDDIAAKFRSANEDLKNTLQGLYTQADVAAGGRIRFDQVIDENVILDRLEEAIRNRGIRSTREISKLKQLANDIKNLRHLSGDLNPDTAPFQTAKRLLDQLNEVAKPASKLENPTYSQKVTRMVAKDVREMINDSVETLQPQMIGLGDDAVTQALQNIRKLNHQSHMFLKLDDVIGRLERQEVRQKFSLTDYIKVGVGAGIGDSLGAAAALASKIPYLDDATLFRFKMLGRLEKYNLQVEKRLVKALDKVADTTQRSFRPLQLGTLKGLTMFNFDENRDRAPSKSETDDQAMERLSEEIYALQTPEVQSQVLERKTQQLHEVAPQVTQALAIKSVAAAQFLASKVPINPYYGRMLNPAHARWKPSAEQKRKFQRYLNAVEDPVSVIEQFADGQLNREGIETLKAVYPEMFQEFQTAVTIAVAQMETPPPYKVRIQLTNLLGISVDPTTEADAVLAFQANLGPTEDDIAQQGASPSRPKVNFENSLATETQEIALNEQPT